MGRWRWGDGVYERREWVDYGDSELVYVVDSLGITQAEWRVASQALGYCPGMRVCGITLAVSLVLGRLDASSNAGQSILLYSHQWIYEG